MDTLSSTEELRLAIAHCDVEKICEIHSDDPNLILHPDNCELRYLLLTEAAYSNSNISKLLNSNFFNFLKLKDEIDLEDFLTGAISNDDLQLTEFLLKSGAKFEGRRWNMAGPLLATYTKIFMSSRRKEMLKLFINHGLKIDVKNEAGQNILHHFIDKFISDSDSDAADIAEILINSGVRLSEKDKEGMTVLARSIFRENLPLISYLISKGALEYESIIFLIVIIIGRSNPEDIFNLLLSYGVDIHIKDDTGFSVLHAVCMLSRNNLIRYLLRKGADVNAQDINGVTPLSALDFEKDDSMKCANTLIKEISKLNFENSPVSECDMKIIQANPEFRENFKKCKNELGQMASTKFYDIYSYYDVLKMSKNIKKLAKLMQNDQFLKKFQEKLPNYVYYMDDLKEIWDEGFMLEGKIVEVYSSLNSVFSQIFPDVVIRKLTDRLAVEDIPLN